MTKTKLIIEINEEILNNPHNFPEYVFRKAVLNGKPLQAEFEEIKVENNEQIDFNESCCERTDLHEAIGIINRRIAELKGENK